MRQLVENARRPLPARSSALASLAPLQHRPLPQAARRARPIRALLRLFRFLFVQPVGRRAREERLRALPDRILRDIGIKRSDARAAAWGLVPPAAVLPDYPSAGPLCVCGRPGFPLTLVRLSKAA